MKFFAVHLPGHRALDMIPKPFRILPEYNAALWDHGLDGILEAAPPDHIKTLAVG